MNSCNFCKDSKVCTRIRYTPTTAARSSGRNVSPPTPSLGIVKCGDGDVWVDQLVGAGGAPVAGETVFLRLRDSRGHHRMGDLTTLNSIYKKQNKTGEDSTPDGRKTISPFTRTDGNLTHRRNIKFTRVMQACIVLII